VSLRTQIALGVLRYQETGFTGAGAGSGPLTPTQLVLLNPVMVTRTPGQWGTGTTQMLIAQGRGAGACLPVSISGATCLSSPTPSIRGTTFSQ
jgi:hypothetical protein